MSPGLGTEEGVRLCRALELSGITHVFGLPGTQTVPFFEALRRSRLGLVLPSSELAAAFMAGAYYRVSGRPAALVTIPGPGFAYALAGLAEARLDSAALLHLTIASPEGPASRFQLQAIPQRAIAGQIAKNCFRVSADGDVGRAVGQALAAAVSGEPGPVVLELGVRAGTVQDDTGVGRPSVPDSRDAATEIWRRLGMARKPVIYAGQGTVPSSAAFRQMVDTLQAPVLTTPSARGVLPEDHPLAMGYDPCRGGTEAANRLLQQSDMVLVLGAKLGHNGTAGRALRFPEAMTYQVDADPDIAGASIPVAGKAICKVQDFLALRDKMPSGESDWSPAELAELRHQVRTTGKTQAEPRVAGGSARDFFGALRSALPRSSILVMDTGLHQILTRRYYEVLEPGGLLFPSDFQSMGFGIPAAIAAKLAAPQRDVVGLVGDGSTAINGLEIATAVDLGLALPIIVFADGFLNQIRLHQHAEFGRDVAVSIPRLNFSALAETTGAAFREVGEDIAGDIQWALGMKRPVLLVVRVDDSAKLVRTRMVARARTQATSMVGPRMVSWLKRFSLR